LVSGSGSGFRIPDPDPMQINIISEIREAIKKFFVIKNFLENWKLNLELGCIFNGLGKKR
jgi:hypothetical protein